jgi:hypothetical protein
MKFETYHLEILKISLTFIGGVFLLWQYFNQLSLSKAKVLDDLWDKFSRDESMPKLFSLMESCELKTENNTSIDALRSFDESEKVKYLAHLSELLIFINAKTFRPKLVDEKKLIHLYKWHFYYIFLNLNTKQHFWNKLLPELDEDETREAYLSRLEGSIETFWSKHLDFSKRCKCYLGE